MRSRRRRKKSPCCSATLEDRDIVFCCSVYFHVTNRNLDTVMSTFNRSLPHQFEVLQLALSRIQKENFLLSMTPSSSRVRSPVPSTCPVRSTFTSSLVSTLSLNIRSIILRSQTSLLDSFLGIPTKLVRSILASTSIMTLPIRLLYYWSRGIDFFSCAVGEELVPLERREEPGSLNLVHGDLSELGQPDFDEGSLGIVL